ncbi:hypothetical protein ABPG75_008043 [Micractinium tetrahymenae]
MSDVFPGLAAAASGLPPALPTPSATDAALAALCAKLEEADIDVLSYFLEEAAGDIAAAEGAYLKSRAAEKEEGSEQSVETTAGGSNAASLPMPIPLGSHQNSAGGHPDNASWDGWAPRDSPPAGGAAMDTWNGGASRPASPPSWALPGSAHGSPSWRRNNSCGVLLAGDLAGMGLGEENLGCTANEVAFLREQAEACGNKAINLRRMNRPHKAAQMERQARQFLKEAHIVQERATAEAFQRNNQDNVLSMPAIDLHDLTVSAALSRVVTNVGLARGFVQAGTYSAVYLPFVTGRGAHSHDGVAKIRAAVEDWMVGSGIEYFLENAGGQLVAVLM